MAEDLRTVPDGLKDEMAWTDQHGLLYIELPPATDAHLSDPQRGGIEHRVLDHRDHWVYQRSALRGAAAGRCVAVDLQLGRSVRCSDAGRLPRIPSLRMKRFYVIRALLQTRPLRAGIKRSRSRRGSEFLLCEAPAFRLGRFTLIQLVGKEFDK